MPHSAIATRLEPSTFRTVGQPRARTRDGLTRARDLALCFLLDAVVGPQLPDDLRREFHELLTSSRVTSRSC